MQVAQYEITLPADYDMAIIRHRVATRGAALDDFGGLGLKAYCIRADGSPVKQYAPFYLWATPVGMNRFFWGGGGFQHIVSDFGRPVVQHWIGLGLVRGPAAATVPRAATRRKQPIAPDADPVPAIEAALAELRDYSERPGVHSSATAIDPRGWELVTFTLWENEAPGTAETRYEVLHLSAPELGDLALGRHW